MPLTPADVHNVAFKKPPIGKRGYDEDEVDAFLDLVEGELARLIEENADLKKQVAEMGSGAPRRPQEAPQPVMAAPPAPPPAPEPALSDHEKASRMLALASQTADRHVAEARAEAQRLVSDAQATHERTVGTAQSKADQLLADSKAKAESLVNDARAHAESLDREARGKAQALAQEAERKHAEVMGGLEERKTTLERRIEELRLWEREYRTRLKSFLESQLRDLDARGSAEPATGGRAGNSVGGSGNATAGARAGASGNQGVYGGQSGLRDR
jgi:DivIVA domain-containing protein